MKEPELDEERLSAGIAASTLTIDRRSVASPAGKGSIPVTITPPSGADTTLVLKPAGPGHATGAMAATAPGIWQVSDGTHLAYAAAGLDNPLEYADLRATADRLHELVHHSGGGIFWLAHGIPDLRPVSESDAAAGAAWAGLRRRDAHLVTGVSTTPLLPAWLALPLLLGLVLAAWRREAS
jgi:hypothetical protein